MRSPFGRSRPSAVENKNLTGGLRYAPQDFRFERNRIRSRGIRLTTYLHLIRNRRGDLVLHGEHIFQFAIVSFRPE